MKTIFLVSAAIVLTGLVACSGEGHVASPYYSDTPIDKKLNEIVLSSSSAVKKSSSSVAKSSSSSEKSSSSVSSSSSSEKAENQKDSEEPET